MGTGHAVATVDIVIIPPPFPSQDRFKGVAFHSRVLFTDLGEGDVADPLARVAAAYPKISIGSYPNTSPEGTQQYKVKFSLNGRDATAVEAAVEAIKAAFGAGFVRDTVK